MGGQGSGIYKNDVWESSNNGATWTPIPPASSNVVCQRISLQCRNVRW